MDVVYSFVVYCQFVDSIGWLVCMFDECYWDRVMSLMCELIGLGLCVLPLLCIISSCCFLCFVGGARLCGAFMLNSLSLGRDFCW